MTADLVVWATLDYTPQVAAEASPGNVLMPGR